MVMVVLLGGGEGKKERRNGDPIHGSYLHPS